MAERWTPEDDLFIVKFYDSIGPFIGPHDLGRTEKATIARARFLKRSGAWDAYIDARHAQNHALKLAGHPSWLHEF